MRKIRRKLQDLEKLRVLRVRHGFDGRGRLQAGNVVLRCALGKIGIGHLKREGDRKTPAGTTRLLNGFFRPDRIRRFAAPIPLSPLRKNQGWCDAPASPRYNRAVTLPCADAHESMWRQDGLYDLVVVLDYNFWPRRKGWGSAIFLHCARPDYGPTLGCVALSKADLRKLLPRLAKDVVLLVM